ncbi:hypothetical protein AAC387_Pa09g1444 [Persea americana]|eukprot:TRINITY_DN6092_c0_g2_i1.p1 TRINITY_DN6092_c0_g2~~TRINITY_DN6092_c0_g2_i1.p1  ORF type:complete len:161 (+),score=28.31 TRINITY_DN6092_c0_g2_i1:130-612(+)
MDGQEQKLILTSVFGDSSSETEAEDICNSISVVEKNPNWDRVKEIEGLWLCQDFLSPERQALLLSSIEREGWFTTASHNQAMRFGDLPEWAIELSSFIREAICCNDGFYPDLCEDPTTYQDKAKACPLSLELLWREPLFDQLIVNVYQPGNMCSCGPHAL